MVSHTALCKIVRGALNLFRCQYAGNFIRAFSLNGHAINPAYYFGSFLVDNPMVFVVGVFLVTVDTVVACVLAGHTSCP